MVLIAVFYLMSRAYIILPAAEGPAAWCMDTWLVMQMSGRWERCSSGGLDCMACSLSSQWAVVRVQHRWADLLLCFLWENVTCKNYGGKTLSHKAKNSTFVSIVSFFFFSQICKGMKTEKSIICVFTSPHYFCITYTSLRHIRLLPPFLLPAVYFHNTTLCFSLSHNSILSLSSPRIFSIIMCASVFNARDLSVQIYSPSNYQQYERHLSLTMCCNTNVPPWEHHFFFPPLGLGVGVSLEEGWRSAAGWGVHRGVGKWKYC